MPASFTCRVRDDEGDDHFSLPPLSFSFPLVSFVSPIFFFPSFLFSLLFFFPLFTPLYFFHNNSLGKQDTASVFLFLGINIILEYAVNANSRCHAVGPKPIVPDASALDRSQTCDTGNSTSITLADCGVSDLGVSQG